MKPKYIHSDQKVSSSGNFNDMTMLLLEQKKDYILPLMKLVYDEPHQYLFINTDSQRLFKGFDEIIID